METTVSLIARVVQNLPVPRHLSPPGCTKSALTGTLGPWWLDHPVNGCPLASLQGRGGCV